MQLRPWEACCLGHPLTGILRSLHTARMLIWTRRQAWLKVGYALWIAAIQVPESDEARKKFGGAKAISSQQYFDRDNKELEAEGQVRLQKFQVSSGSQIRCCTVCCWWQQPPPA